VNRSPNPTRLWRSSSRRRRHRLTYTVDVDDEQRGLPWFVETLNDCADILPINYCFDLGLPHRSTYGDAVKHLAKEASK